MHYIQSWGLKRPASLQAQLWLSRGFVSGMWIIMLQTFFIPQALTVFFGLCAHLLSSEARYFLASFLSPNLMLDILAAFFWPTHLPFSVFIVTSVPCVGVVTFSCWPIFSGPQDAHRDIQRFRPNSNSMLKQLEDVSSQCFGTCYFLHMLWSRVDPHKSLAWTFLPNLGKLYATWTQFFSSNNMIFHWKFSLVFQGASHALHTKLLNEPLQ